MANLISNSIKVFPSAKRGANATYADSRLTTEASFVNIINQLVDSKKFVITEEFNPSSSFEFNIHGYYFRVASGQALINLVQSSDNQIWAGIKLVKIGDNYELDGTDANNVYEGLQIGNSETSATPTHSDNDRVFVLQLLEKDNNWKIPISSQVRFDKALGNIIVNGGEI